MWLLFPMVNESPVPAEEEAGWTLWGLQGSESMSAPDGN
jgi:hypothetical protein